MDADIVVIGGGAAGLMAAIRAAHCGARVALLEKNKRGGAKILISGGGRCNLTTTREGAELLRSFRAPQDQFLRFAFKALPPARLRTYFSELGVATVEEEYEKVFPEAGKALVVLEALLRDAQAKGVEIRNNTAVTGLERAGDAGFLIHTASGTLRAACVILASGGRSMPRSGTTGDGYSLAAGFGHTVSAQYPALAALLVDDRELRSLSGLSVDDAAVSVPDAQGKLTRFVQPILFTHEGLSGPGPMDVSGAIEAQGGATIELDFLASIPEEALDNRLAEAARAGDRIVENLFPPGLPARLRSVLLQKSGVPGQQRGCELRRDQRVALVKVLKHLPVRVQRSRGFDHAEVTRGGVELGEVDPKSMESRLAPGLFICGEVLDIDGPIGGFNFQAAFSTGWVAGEAAGRRSSKSSSVLDSRK